MIRGGGGGGGIRYLTTNLGDFNGQDPVFLDQINISSLNAVFLSPGFAKNFNRASCYRKLTKEQRRVALISFAANCPVSPLLLQRIVLFSFKIGKPQVLKMTSVERLQPPIFACLETIQDKHNFINFDFLGSILSDYLTNYSLQIFTTTQTFLYGASINQCV